MSGSEEVWAHTVMQDAALTTQKYDQFLLLRRIAAYCESGLMLM